MRAHRGACLFCWIIILLATFGVSAVVHRAYVNAYQDGLTLAKGLHVFGWMLTAMSLVAPAILIALAVVWLFILAGPQRRDRKLLAGGGTFSALCIVLGLSSISIMESGFQRGRRQAYRSIHPKELADACMRLKLVTFATTQPVTHVEPSDPSYPKLPSEIRALKPRDVYIGHRGVVIWIDGGGPAAHEGIFVPVVKLTGTPRQFASKYSLTALYETEPVFGFSLYDWRMLPYDNE